MRVWDRYLSELTDESAPICIVFYRYDRRAYTNAHMRVSRNAENRAGGMRCGIDWVGAVERIGCGEFGADSAAIIVLVVS